MKSFVCVRLLMLGSVLACGGSSEPDPGACERYKAALRPHYACDRAIVLPPLNGTYDAYECSPASLEELDDCAQYLNALVVDGVCEVRLGAERERCKTGLLVRGAGASDAEFAVTAADVGNGENCSFLARVELTWEPFIMASETCSAGVCLYEQPSPSLAAHGYCTCRCASRSADYPVCTCPSGFTCTDWVPDGYCIETDDL